MKMFDLKLQDFRKLSDSSKMQNYVLMYREDLKGEGLKGYPSVEGYV